MTPSARNESNNTETDGLAVLSQLATSKQACQVVSEEIIRVLEKERPDADAAHRTQLARSAPRIAKHLLHSAKSLKEYCDVTTLRTRLVQLWERRRKRRMRFILDSPILTSTVATAARPPPHMGTKTTTPVAPLHKRKKRKTGSGSSRTSSENNQPPNRAVLEQLSGGPNLPILVPKTHAIAQRSAAAAAAALELGIPQVWMAPPTTVTNEYYRMCCELAQENVRLQRLLLHQSTTTNDTTTT